MLLKTWPWRMNGAFLSLAAAGIRQNALPETKCCLILKKENESRSCAGREEIVSASQFQALGICLLSYMLLLHPDTPP